jgi:hypothetical protein
MAHHLPLRPPACLSATNSLPLLTGACLYFLACNTSAVRKQADFVGAQVGDVIIAIDGVVMTDKPHKKVVAALSGKNECLVTLKPAPSTRKDSTLIANGRISDQYVEQEVPPEVSPTDPNYFQSPPKSGRKGSGAIPLASAALSPANPRPAPDFVVDANRRPAGTRAVSVSRTPGKGLGLGLEDSRVHKISQVVRSFPAPFSLTASTCTGSVRRIIWSFWTFHVHFSARDD